MLHTTPPRRLRPAALALVALALCATAALGPGVHPVAAQAGPPQPTATTMVLEVPDPADFNLVHDSGNLAYFGQRYAVFADGALCVEDVLPPGGGAFWAVLGAAGQPEECGTAGAYVEIAGLRAGPFTFTTTLTPGTTVTLSNWAPYPTETTFPAYVCTWLAGHDVDRGECAALAAPPPSAAGSAGLEAERADEEGRAMALLMLVLTLAGAATARAIARR